MLRRGSYTIELVCDLVVWSLLPASIYCSVEGQSMSANTLRSQGTRSGGKEKVLNVALSRWRSSRDALRSTFPPPLLVCAFCFNIPCVPLPSLPFHLTQVLSNHASPLGYLEHLWSKVRPGVGSEAMTHSGWPAPMLCLLPPRLMMEKVSSSSVPTEAFLQAEAAGRRGRAFWSGNDKAASSQRPGPPPSIKQPKCPI